jgi:hypothetical protein
MAIDASWKHADPIRAFVYAHFRISWLLPADIKRICDEAGSQIFCCKFLRSNDVCRLTVNKRFDP